MDSLTPTLLFPFVLVSVRPERSEAESSVRPERSEAETPVHPERSEAESKDPLMPSVSMVQGFLEK